MYRLSKDGLSIHRLDDGATIPMCDDNLDYKKYQKWVDDGNSPEPAQTKEELEKENNALIMAELAIADLKAIRALLEKDQARIDEINQAQKDRRKKLIPPG